MTEDYAIQQERKGNYAIPGLLAGGVIGGATGVAGAHYKNWGITQKPSEEQVAKMFEQEPDSFNGKIERSNGDLKSFYEEAKKQAQEVKDAGAEFDKILEEVKKSGGEINVTELAPEDEARKALETAQGNYKREFDRLLAKENGNALNTIANIDIRDPKFPNVTDLKTEELLKEGVTDNWFNRNNAANEFRTMTNKVTNATNAVKSSIEGAGQPGGLRKAALELSSSGTDSIADLFTNFKTNYSTVADDAKASFFKKTVVQAGATVTTKQYNDAYDLAKKLIVDPVKINNPDAQFEHYLKFGEFIEGDKPVQGLGENLFSMKYTDSTGHHEGWIKYTDEAKNAYEKGLKDAVEVQRTKFAEQMLEKGKTYVDLAERAKPDAIKEAIKKQFSGSEYREYLDGLGSISSGSGAGATTARVCDSTTWIDIDALLKEVNPSNATNTVAVEGKVLTGYDNDIHRLRQAVENKSKKLPKNLNGSYCDVAGRALTNPADALAMAEKRASIVSAHKELSERLGKEIQECMADNNYIRDLDERIAKAYSEDKALTKAWAELTERFDKVFKKGESSTPEEIKARVEAMMKDTDVAKLLEDAKTRANARLTELGKPTGELTGEALEKALRERCGAATKEEFTKNVTDKAMQTLKEKSKNVKIANKTWTGLAVGTALAIIGLGIGIATKKDNA